MSEIRCVLFQMLTIPEIWLANYFVPESMLGEIAVPNDIEKWGNSESDCSLFEDKLHELYASNKIKAFFRDECKHDDSMMPNDGAIVVTRLFLRIVSMC
jgi:hypothetical protein